MYVLCCYLCVTIALSFHFVRSWNKVLTWLRFVDSASFYVDTRWRRRSWYVPLKRKSAELVYLFVFFKNKKKKSLFVKTKYSKYQTARLKSQPHCNKIQTSPSRWKHPQTIRMNLKHSIRLWTVLTRDSKTELFFFIEPASLKCCGHSVDVYDTDYTFHACVVYEIHNWRPVYSTLCHQLCKRAITSYI